MTENASGLEEGTARPFVLSGVIAEQVHVIGRSTISLGTTFVRDPEGDQVLLPLIDWQLLGNPVSSGTSPDRLMGVVLSVDNMAFVVNNICDDMNRSVSALSDLLRGSGLACGLDVKSARDWLKAAAEKAHMAASVLDQIEDEFMESETATDES